MQSMRAIVTCGPSYEPIDHVRRLTNASTGELGIVLCGALSAAGWEVICLKGAGANSPLPVSATTVSTFTTNEHLLGKLRRLARQQKIDALFHAAALTDFRVTKVRGAGGDWTNAAKISSAERKLTIVLEPAAKIIEVLRDLFPHAYIVGWKYELEGRRAGAVANGRRQIFRARTDLCVVNGRAYGPGFGIVSSGPRVNHYRNKRELCARLAKLATVQAAAHPSPHGRRPARRAKS
jgi:phosphopantothenate---cysteine ligase (CTP)